MFWHDGKLRQLCKQNRIRALGVNDDSRIILRNRIADLIELAYLRAGECRVDDPFDAESNVLSRQRCTIVEFHVIADFEFDFRIGKILPLGGDLRSDLAFVVTRQQIVENIAIDIEAVGVPLHMRVQRARFCNEIHCQQIFRAGIMRLGSERCCCEHRCEECVFKAHRSFSRGFPGFPN